MSKKSFEKKQTRQDGAFWPFGLSTTISHHLDVNVWRELWDLKKTHGQLTETRQTPLILQSFD